MGVPDTTIAIVLDVEHFSEWKLTLPTWLSWHPELCECQWLLMVESPELEPAVEDFFSSQWSAACSLNGSLADRSKWRVESWGECPPECDSQRKRALWQYLVHVPRLVETPRWVKIDTDAVGMAHDTGEGWLGLGAEADVTGSPWGYTKPAGALAKLGEWYGATIPHRSHPDKDKAPRLIGWLSAHSRDFTTLLAERVTESTPPVVSHDTLTWFTSRNWAPYPYARFGWRHVSKRHLQAAVEASQNPLPVIPPHSQSVVDLIDSLGVRCNRVVEIGCFQGQTSHAILSRCPHVRLTMVDPWAEFDRGGEYFASGDNRAKQSQAAHDLAFEVAMAATEPFANRRFVVRTDSLSGAKMAASLPDSRIDLGFVDGDHTKPAVAADCEAWYPLVRPGGILCGHDYGHPRFHGVKQAVDEFAKANRLELTIHPGTVWSVVKPKV